MQIHHIPVKTGTVHTLMKNPPLHLKEAAEYEPLYPPQEFILEETLRREAERATTSDNHLGRVVYDAVNPSNYWANGEAPPNKDGELPPYYVQHSENDSTIQFESRFESGNLRRAI